MSCTRQTWLIMGAGLHALAPYFTQLIAEEVQRSLHSLPRLHLLLQARPPPAGACRCTGAPGAAAAPAGAGRTGRACSRLGLEP